jgi:hypothetical protein
LQCCFLIFDYFYHAILFFFLALSICIRIHKVLALTHWILQILGRWLVMLQAWWNTMALISLMIFQCGRRNFVTSLYEGFLLVGQRKVSKKVMRK